MLGDADQAAPIAYQELVTLLAGILRRNGASPEVAEIIATNCAGCERDGATSHGVFRMPGYVSSIRSGWVDAMARPRLDASDGALLRVDAGNGFAQPALELARPLLMQRVRQQGIAMLAIRNSHHFSALWPDVEPFAVEGLMALTMVNSFACTVAFDGTRPVFGTNPIAFAAPRASGTPLVADMATSAIANGDVQIARREGRAIPEGHGIDAQGRPTTDPNKVLEGGALLTFGGYKGSAISLLVELFGAALTGGKFSYEVDWSGHPGAQTPHTGQTVILVEPDFGRQGGGFFAARADDLIRQLKISGVNRLPGDRRVVTRRRNLRDGIPLSASQLRQLRELAGDS